MFILYCTIFCYGCTFDFVVFNLVFQYYAKRPDGINVSKMTTFPANLSAWYKRDLHLTDGSLSHTSQPAKWYRNQFSHFYTAHLCV